MKTCSTCKETKPFEMFSKNRSRKDGYQSRCKDCEKAYYEVNREKRVEQMKACYEANKEKYAEQQKAYYEANKEKIAAYREANKEKVAEYNKVYREANKEKRSEWNSRRRARKRNAIPKFLRNCQEEKKRLRDIYRLRIVLSVATGIEHHVDHMWPISDGGPHWSGNLQVIPAKENLTKNAKVCKLTKKNIRDSLRITRKEYEDRSNGHRDR